MFELESKTGGKKIKKKIPVTQSLLGMQVSRKGVRRDLSTGLHFRQRLPRNSRAHNYRRNLS